MKELRFLPEILDDLTTAADWYEEVAGTDLAKRFIDNFYSALPDLARNAEIHRKVYAEFRRILLPPFPYKIYFRVTAEAVVITLIIHGTRDPQLIEELLNQRQLSKS